MRDDRDVAEVRAGGGGAGGAGGSVRGHGRGHGGTGFQTDGTAKCRTRPMRRPPARLTARHLDRLAGMFVAAAIFAAQPASALADVAGVPAARHLAELARQAGIATVLVISFDAEGSVAAAIEGLATL